MKRTRKLLILAVAGVSVIMAVATAPPAMADNGPHKLDIGISASILTTDACAGCHRAHTGQAAMILKTDEVDLCYTCHGTAGLGSDEDVRDGVSTAGGGGALRGGGFEFALIDSHNPSYTPGTGFGVTGTGVNVPVLGAAEATTSSHSVDGSAQTIWGSGALANPANYGASINLECTSCHDPHGNGQYRILLKRPGGAAADVVIPDILSGGGETYTYTTDNYWKVGDINQAQSYFPAALVPKAATNSDWFQSNTDWCKQCHTRYQAYKFQRDINGNPTPSYQWALPGTGDAVFNFKHTTEPRTGYSVWADGGAAPTTYTNSKPRFCLNCHVAHGSNADNSGASSSTVAFPDGTVVADDSKLLRIDGRGTCRVCHAYGWSAT